MDLKLSVLDQILIPPDCTAQQAIEHSLSLAQSAEKWGYNRYWFAEHHAPECFASTAPELMIPLVAQSTNTIRIGSGGVMLSHYSPLKVAENFNMLSSLFPDRVDLGIGRSDGASDETANAMAYTKAFSNEDFPKKLLDTYALTHQEQAPSPVLNDVQAGVTPTRPAEMWLLGSTENSAKFAAENGLPYCFAYFISPDRAAGALEIYRQNFQPRQSGEKPSAMMAIAAYCADTEYDAKALGIAHTLWMYEAKVSRKLLPWPTIEQAMAYAEEEPYRSILEQFDLKIVTGTPDSIKPKILDIAKTHGIDELLVLSNCNQLKQRETSYRLLSETFLR